MKVRWVGVWLMMTMPVATAAYAQNEGPFVGASLGPVSRLDYRHPIEADNTAIGVNIFGGYRVRDAVSVSAGFLTLGSYHAEGAIFGGFEDDVSVKGLHLKGLAHVPVSSKASILGSFGLYLWKYNYRSDDSENPDRRLNDSGNSVTFGFGVDLRARQTSGGDILNVRIEWQHLRKVGDRQTVEHVNNYNALTFGIVYEFRK